MKTPIHILLFALMACGVLSGCRVDDITRAIGMAGKHAENLNRAGEDFTPEQEYYLGRAVGAQILAKYPALKDKEANSYLNKVGQALAMCSAQPYTYGGYHFMILDSGEVNAFAAPDGLIFVTRGMLGLTRGEAELAAVLAHEIAHVQNEDAIKAIQNSRLTEAMALIGKDAAGQYGSSLPAGQLVSLFSDSVNDIVVTLVTKGYSRGQEYAADAAALDILAATGYDPAALSAVLRSMEKRVSGGSPGFGSTHPSASDRLGSLPQPGATAGPEPTARESRFKKALGKYSVQ